MSGNWSVDLAPARELIQGFQRHLEQSLVSLQVHAIALQVGCCLAVHEDLAETRIAALEQQLSAIKAAQERFTNAMRTKIDGLSLRLRGMEKEQRSRENLHQPLMLMEHELDEARSNLAKRIAGCREFLLEAKQEFQVIVETDETGQIRTARRLLPLR
jgi:DNA repair exonuclease SbcCD ATPase subunit